jgi:hypothetical protein
MLYIIGAVAVALFTAWGAIELGLYLGIPRLPDDETEL